MNERIRQFAEQAGAEYSDFYSVSLLDKEIEVFAELILNRVLEMVNAHESIFDKPDERALIKHIARSIQIDFEIK
jgi:hypothetical protein